MTPRHWFVKEAGADSVARRHEVWALLGWYHQTVVEPQIGFLGAFRRLWWLLTGQHHRLLSPWKAIEERVMEIKARREAMHEQARQNGHGA